MPEPTTIYLIRHCQHFDARLGFAEWQLLSNPDVYRVVLATPEPAQLLRL